MKAKDTVMQDSEVFSRMRDKFLGLDATMGVDWELIKITKTAQAEISFKAGQESVLLESKMGTLTVSSLVNRGRRDVVEWIETHNSFTYRDGEPATVLRFYSEDEFEAQKKEWGL